MNDEFIESIDNMSQEILIELFFDWYDWYNQYPNESTLLKLRELRKRIHIFTTVGIKDSVL